MQNKKFIKELSFYGAALLLAVLPFNVFVSWGIVLFLLASLVSCWNADGLLRLKQNKVVLYFVLPYFIYVLGLLYTENINQGWKELEYKLSFLLVPLAVAVLPKFKNYKLESLYKILLTSTLFATLYCLLVASVHNGFSALPTYSDLSLHHHPTYLSLYVNVATIVASYFFRKGFLKGLMLSLMAYFVVFNFLLSSKIGILFAVGFLLYFSIVHLSKSVTVKLVQIGVLIGLFFAIWQFVPKVAVRFQKLISFDFSKNIDPESVESNSVRILIWAQAIEIVQEHPIIGVGTGDTKDQLMLKYEENGITHAFKSKLNSHNQIFEWLVTFGLLGSILLLFCLVQISGKAYRQRNRLYFTFLVLLLSYLLVEAVFEKESGIVFITCMFAFLFFQPLSLATSGDE